MSIVYNECMKCKNNVYEEDTYGCKTCHWYICDRCLKTEHRNDDTGSPIKDDKNNSNPQFVLDWDGYLKSEYCPTCKANKKNKKKVVVGNSFETKYFWKKVLVEIKEILD